MATQSRLFILGALLTTSLIASDVSADTGTDRMSHHPWIQMHGAPSDHHRNYGLSEHDAWSYDYGPGMIDWMQSRLNLSKEQAIAVKEVTENMRNQSIPIADELRNYHNALDIMIYQGVYNETEVSRIAKIIGDLKAQLLVLHTKSRIDIFNLLDESQKEKFKQLTDWRGW